MLKTIWKYELPLETSIKIDLPKGAKILSFQIQHEKPCIWVLVDVEAPLETRSFLLVGTGHAISAESIFLGTIQFDPQDLVCHLFEKI